MTFENNTERVLPTKAILGGGGAPHFAASLSGIPTGNVNLNSTDHTLRLKEIFQEFYLMIYVTQRKYTFAPYV